MTSRSFALLLLFSIFNTVSYGQENPVIIGYVMGSRIDSINTPIAVNKLTHINYAFANIEDGKIIDGHENDSLHLAWLNSLKKKNPDLKILVSVGGWSWSGGFSDAALTQESREIFANSAIELIKRHHLDGIDLDWEYPGQSGAGNTYRPEDKQNFTLTLKRIREKLDSLSAVTGHTPYLQTIATAANKNYLAHVEGEKIAEYLDYINIMSYDYNGEWSALTGHHTNLYPSPNDPAEYKQSTDTAVLEHLKAGIPPEKLVVGIAFYGRGWNNVTPKNNGLYQESNGGFSVPYKKIADTLDSGNFKVFRDLPAAAPYLWDPSGRVFVTYDDKESVTAKANYILKNGLGGAMFWEYHADNNELLNTLYRELSGK
ncbi:glycoside hydrolase family 18 protein [Robertkochia solimangrovi]|uniref:glycoside hydrolase family 18 protein n=1 Tax=Robertkochia solimangrovi TaxID=2213046 RepID=UPI00117C129C|nr:glycoside hydrolase family 18 protein [Robertkochia solimangrovi]TRZ42587.1 hypothetical protein DMZ48_13895 [Robertkochia solimangrovi]